MYFNEFWMANTRKCEHIKHENYDLCHRNEKKFNQKFALLKVASDKSSVNISHSTMTGCVPFKMAPMLFIIEQN
jgi:uncharacterized protein (UPF0179 family)